MATTALEDGARLDEYSSALLFVVAGQPRQDAIDHPAVADAATPRPEAQPPVARRNGPLTTAAQLDRSAHGLLQTIGVRLDDESARMLTALMADEDQPACRALVAQWSATEGTLPETPHNDHM